MSDGMASPFSFGAEWLAGAASPPVWENDTDAHCGFNRTDPYCLTSAWAISLYCFGASFIFGLSQIVTRTLMAKKASTQVMMHGINSTTAYSVKRGRTRLIPELLTLSFLFRGVWFFMKGRPGEPWACFTDGTEFPYETEYGNWQYALREMFNRFATLMSFSAFTVLVIYWAGTSTIGKKFKGSDDGNSRLGEFTPGSRTVDTPKYTCCQGFYVSLNVWLYLALIGITVVNFIPNDLNEHCIPQVEGYYAKNATQCWCEPGQTNFSAGKAYTRADACLVNRTYLSGLFTKVNSTYTYRKATPWANLKEGTILFTNALYILLVLGLSVFGAKVMRALRAIHTTGPRGTTAAAALGSAAGASETDEMDSDSDVETHSNRPRKRKPAGGRRSGGGGSSGSSGPLRRQRICGIESMRCKILVMIISSCLCFSARFVLFVWPYLPIDDDLKQFTGIACTVLR